MGEHVEQLREIYAEVFREHARRRQSARPLRPQSGEADDPVETRLPTVASHVPAFLPEASESKSAAPGAALAPSAANGRTQRAPTPRDQPSASHALR
jgi:hypothetical protein